MITPYNRTLILIRFLAQVKTRYYGNGAQVCVQTVTQELRTISKTLEYIIPVKRLVEGLRIQDTLYIPQMTVTVDVTENAMNLACLTSNVRSHAVGYLITT